MILNPTEPSAKSHGLEMRRKKDRKQFVLLPTTCQIIRNREFFLLVWMIKGLQKISL